MPNGLTNLTGGIVEQTGNTIGNIARAATTRHRHSTHLSSTAIPVPPPPQHTNISHHHSTSSTLSSSGSHSHRLSADYTTTSSSSTSLPNTHHTSMSPNPSNTQAQQTIVVDHANKRHSQVGLSLADGPVSNMTIEFDGGTHVIVRPNRIIRGKVYFMRCVLYV